MGVDLGRVLAKLLVILKVELRVFWLVGGSDVKTVDSMVELKVGMLGMKKAYMKVLS